MPTWYKMRYNFSHEHNMSNIKALQYSIMNRLESNYANVVIKNNKIVYELWHIVVHMGIILSIMGKFFEHCSKA